MTERSTLDGSYKIILLIPRHYMTAFERFMDEIEPPFRLNNRFVNF